MLTDELPPCGVHEVALVDGLCPQCTAELQGPCGHAHDGKSCMLLKHHHSQHWTESGERWDNEDYHPDHRQSPEGFCNARLYIGDDYGDNSCTMVCELEPHTSDVRHRETWRDGVAVVSWTGCDRTTKEDDDLRFAVQLLRDEESQ